MCARLGRVTGWEANLRQSPDHHRRGLAGEEWGLPNDAKVGQPAHLEAEEKAKLEELQEMVRWENYTKKTHIGEWIIE